MKLLKKTYSTIGVVVLFLIGFAFMASGCSNREPKILDLRGNQDVEVRARVMGVMLGLMAEDMQGKSGPQNCANKMAAMWVDVEKNYNSGYPILGWEFTRLDGSRFLVDYNQFSTCKLTAQHGIEAVKAARAGKTYDPLAPVAATPPVQQAPSPVQASVVTAAPSPSIPNPPATNQPILPNLAALIGKDPEQVIKHPEIKSRFSSLLGKNQKNFIDRFGVSSNTVRQGDWLFGSGIAPHSGGIDEAAFAINLSTGAIFATMLIDGKQILYFGVDSPQKLPPPLFAWYRDNGGQ